MLHNFDYAEPEPVLSARSNAYTYRFGIEPSTWPSAAERLVIAPSGKIYDAPTQIFSMGVSDCSELIAAQVTDALNAYSSFTACDWGKQLLAGVGTRIFLSHHEDAVEEEVFPHVESPVMIFAEKGETVRLRGRVRGTRPPRHNLVLSSDELSSFMLEEDDE